MALWDIYLPPTSEGDTLQSGPNLKWKKLVGTC